MKMPNEITIPTCQSLCQYFIPFTMAGWGIIAYNKCSKIAVIKDVHERKLCTKHYNKWAKKYNKNRKKPFEGVTI